MFAGLITVWLWFTVLFANLAEAMAEGRGRRRPTTLRAHPQDTVARRLRPDGSGERRCRRASSGRATWWSSRPAS